MNKKLAIGLIAFESFLGALFLVFALYQKAEADKQREAAFQSEQKAIQQREEAMHQRLECEQFKARLEDCYRQQN
jgi:hypothetical protein